jgi:NADH-quinone oxidoreductase subunit L
VIHALAGEQDLRNMGGLKKALPITYWTFLIGAIAIAGVPPLAGFFSKDEILWKTYAGGHTLLWTIGMVTAFLTATYMFRLVFLAFHGERRHDAPAAPDQHPQHHQHQHDQHAQHLQHQHDQHAPHLQHQHDQHPQHLQHQHDQHAPHDQHHAAHLHDAPPAMAFALIVLAIGSVVAGLVGIPHAIGGGNRIEAFLEPSFEAHATAPGNPEFQVVQGRPGDTRVELRTEPVEHAGAGTETVLMGVSVGTAVAGIVLAMYFWLRNRPAATRVARSAAPLYTLLLNKYYVDEIYNAVIVQPIKGISSLVLWRGVDAGLIDGAVNGVGGLVRASSSSLRRLQTGSVRAYAASLFFGVVVILGWYLLR